MEGKLGHQPSGPTGEIQCNLWDNCIGEARVLELTLVPNKHMEQLVRYPRKQLWVRSINTAQHVLRTREFPCTGASAPVLLGPEACRTVYKS